GLFFCGGGVLRWNFGYSRPVHSLRSLGNSYQHERGDLEGSLEKWIVGTGRVSIPARAGGHRVRADLPRRWTDCAGWHTARRRRAIKEGLSSSPRADQSRPVNSEAEAELSPRCNLAKRHFARNIILIHQIPHAFFHAADMIAIIYALVYLQSRSVDIQTSHNFT